MGYTVINAPLSPTGGKFAHHIPSGSVIYHSADGITTVYAPDGKIILKARDSDAALVAAGFGSVPATKVHYVPNGSRFTIEPSKFNTADRGWIAGNTTKTYAPDGTLVLTVIHEKRMQKEETFTTENQSEEYVVKINAPLTPVEGESTNHVPRGSLIYRSYDGITTVYAPDGKIILKARDISSKTLPISGLMEVPWRNITASHGPKWATHVSGPIGVPNCTYTYEPFKFYTEDRGWIIGNATKCYGPDGRLLIIGTSEKRTKIVKTLTTENLSAEEMVKITNHVPPGSLVYHSDDGITLVYAPDGKIIVKARDFDAKTVPMSGLIPVPGRNITAREPKWATLVSAVSAVPNCTHIYEPFKFYTEDRGWIIGNAVKSYGPDGTLLLIGTSEKDTTCEKIVDIPKLGDSEFSGVLERTEDHVNTLDEFTAYWDCPSAPPSPNPNVGVLLFNAVQDYTDWGKILQPVICWTAENGHWIAYSMWGPDTPGGDYYPTSPIIDVDVGDKLKGEIKWDDTASCWHICIYNLDKGTISCVDCSRGDNAELDIFTVLEAPAPYHVSDFTDLPGDTTFYDMSFKSQGSPVDIEWVKNVNSTAKGLIPELDVIVYSDSKVKLVTRKEIKPLDVILVTDRSGSMEYDRLENAKTAAKTFVDQLKAQDKVGLVSFNDSATLDRHLTSDFNDVKNVIDSYSASGGTYMGDGLTKAINELETNGRGDSIHVIIVLSDGWTWDEDEILNTIVPQAKDAGIVIYTFGYGWDVDLDLLTQIAVATGGEYHFEPDTATIISVYNQLQLKEEAVYEGSVAQDETAEEFHWLDVLSEILKIVLYWPGSDLDLTIIDPSGTVIEPGMPGVIYSGNDACPEYYEIHNPQPGKWTIQIYGKNVTGGYENYTVPVFVGGMELPVFFDDFNADLIDTSKWNPGYGRIEDDMLVIGGEGSKETKAHPVFSRTSFKPKPGKPVIFESLVSIEQSIEDDGRSEFGLFSPHPWAYQEPYNIGDDLDYGVFFEAAGEHCLEIRPKFKNRGTYQYVGEWKELSGYPAYFKIVMDMDTASIKWYVNDPWYGEYNWSTDFEFFPGHANDPAYIPDMVAAFVADQAESPWAATMRVEWVRVQAPIVESDRPDIVVTDIEVPEMMRPNIYYQISATIKNQGTIDATEQFNVNLEIDGNHYDKVGGIGPLAAGESTTVSFSVSLPEGCHNFSVVADCDNNINESDETNNAILEYNQVGNVIVARSNSDFDELVWEGLARKNGDTYYIEDLTITNCAGCGITIENTTVPFIITNCTVHNCYIEEYWMIESYDGICLRNLANGKINDCTVKNNTGNGISIQNSTHVDITNNLVQDNWRYGIEIYPRALLFPFSRYLDDSRFINITNNTIKNNCYNIVLIGSNCTIRGNTITG